MTGDMMLFAMKDNSQKKIKFICEDEALDFFPRPTPASKILPEWYKKMESYTGENGKKQYDSQGVNGTIKKCMPVFDSLTSGYIIVSPFDIYVSRDDNENPTFSWTIDWKAVTEHANEQANTINIPPEYDSHFFKWSNPWIIKTPPGYSCLFIQPFHNYDLPSYIMPGIVDTDNFKLSVQFPFFLRKDFSGLIKAGTPVAQIIPFKRDEWTSEYSSVNKKETQKNLDNHSRFMENRYKRTFWNKKVFK